MGAVQSAQRLHRLHVLQLLIHEHRVQQRLVEACLVFVSHHEHVVHVRCEVQRQTFLADVHPVGGVQFRLGIFLAVPFHLARECHHRLNVRVTLLLAVALDLHEVAQGMDTACRDHHRLRLSLHGVQRHLAELLHDDFHLLIDDVLVVVVERLHGTGGWFLFVLRIILYLLTDFIRHAIRRILQQHILDEALFYGLQH